MTMDDGQWSVVESMAVKWLDETLTTDERNRATALAKHFLDAHGADDGMPEVKGDLTPGQVRHVLIKQTCSLGSDSTPEQREARALLDKAWQQRMADDLGRPVCGVAPRNGKGAAKPVKPTTRSSSAPPTKTKATGPRNRHAVSEKKGGGGGPPRRSLRACRRRWLAQRVARSRRPRR